MDRKRKDQKQIRHATALRSIYERDRRLKAVKAYRTLVDIIRAVCYYIDRRFNLNCIGALLWRKTDLLIK